MTPSWLPDVRECAGKSVLCIVGALQEIHGTSTTPETHRLFNAGTFLRWAEVNADAAEMCAEGLTTSQQQVTERNRRNGAES